jgi:hypothetical protein
VRSIDGRISKLENRFGLAKHKPRHLLILDDGSQRALSDDKCIEILDEAGLLPTNGFGVVDLTDIPAGLSSKELETFLREGGAHNCGQRLAPSPREDGDASMKPSGPRGLPEPGASDAKPAIKIELV